MKKECTKGRIVGAAIRLFNERGTAAVSTNHIAEEAGISPGNLYYHFRNKEEIIRAVFGRIDAFWEQSYVLPPDRTPTLADMQAMVEETFLGLWEYRFFYRELGALTRRDTGLARHYLLVRERGVNGTEALLETFVEAGVLKQPEDHTAMPELAKALMLVAEFWLPFEEVDGGLISPERMREGVDLMTRILAPRLTEKGQTGLDPEERETADRTGAEGKAK